MKNLSTSLVRILSSVLIASVIAGGISYYYNAPQFESVGSPTTAEAVNFVGGEVYTLAGSGVDSTATTVVLTDFDIPVSGTNLTMADFGDIGYGTIEPGTSRQEFISFTGITQNSDGTADLTGVTRGLSPVSPYTESATYKLAHAGGSKFVISNTPQFYSEAAFKGNDETITGTWTFNNFPITPDNGTSTESAAGVVELATQIEMASSTSLGATGAHLVLQALYATSTAPSSGLYAVISQNDGNIDEGWLPAIFNGVKTFTATTTFSNDIEIAEAFQPNIQVYTASTTWTKPNGLEYAIIEVVGGGGGGGGASDSTPAAAGGGGGGGYAKIIVDASDLGATETVTVGAAGTAGESANGNGGNGGTTTFTVTGGSTLTATGGTGGDGGTLGAGGAGGVGSNGDLNAVGGGGGGGMQDDANRASGGTGGSSFFGGGAEGVVDSTTGEAGNNYGGGGGGAAVDGTARAGGTGAAGVVIVTEYFF